MASHAPSPDPATLLAELEWVRRLAQSLVGDPALADDVVQETWVAARSAPAPGNSPRWLAQVVRNAVRQVLRREGRRAERERHAARPEALPSTLALVERASAQRKVVECVLALDEPYRSFVLLRWFEDLSPTEIAERTGTPLATVKTRLRRALDRLREQLDRAHGGDGRAWLAALAPLIPKSVPLASAAATGGIAMSVKSITIGIAAAAALFAVGLWSWRTLGESDPRLAAAPVPEQGAQPPRLETAAEETTPAPAEEHDANQIASRTDESPTGIPLLVVAAATGEPVASAELWYGTPEWAEWHSASRLGTGAPVDREALVRSTGRRATTDDAGRATLRDVSGWFAITARAGDLYAEAQVRSAGDLVRVELHPDVAIRIQVVDESGAPRADVPVGVGAGRGSGVPHASWFARTTAPDGIAVIEHIYQRVPELRDPNAWGMAELCAAFRDRVTASFDLAHPPTEPIRFVLPATGRLVVVVEDETGKPMPDNWVYATPVLTGRELENRNLPAPRHDRLSRDGRAIFEHVELGLTFSIWHQQYEHRHFELVRPGPTAAGEEVVVVLCFDERLPAVTGVVKDEAGEVLANATVAGQVRIEGDNGESRTGDIWAQTDANGRFRQTIDVEDAVGRHFTVHLRSGVGQGPALSADVVPAVPLEALDNDLGEIVLGPPPVVLSGTVRDDRGEPINWACIDIARKERYSEADDRWRWVWLGDLRAMTDRHGEFTSIGTLDAGEYAFKASADGHVGNDYVPFEPGTRSLEIVLTRVGKLEGSVLLPDGVSGTEISLDVLAPGMDDAPPQFGSIGSPLTPPGRFVVDVAHGTVDVRLWIDAGLEPVHVVPDVEIRPGATTSDPRLQDIHLRERIWPVELEMTGVGGERVAQALVTAWPSNDFGATPRRVTTDDGVLSMVCPWPVVDVEVFAPGYRTARVAGVRARSKVVLELGIPVRVRLPADVELPHEGDGLRLALIERSREDARAGFYPEAVAVRQQLLGWYRLQGDVFDDSRELVLRLPAAGEYSVRWSVVTVTDRRADRPVRSSRGKDVLSIQESDADRTFELAPDLEDLRRVLAR